MPSQKKKTFRLQAKKYFLTFPKCNEQPDIILKKINEMYKHQVEKMVVAQEKHKDDTLHLHVVIAFKNKVTSTEKKLDNITGKRGNYQSCRSLWKTFKYVIKDKNYVVHPPNFNVENFVKLSEKKKNPKSDEVAQLINEGVSLKEINEEYSGFMLMNLQKIEKYKIFLNHLNQPEKEKMFGFTESQNTNEEYIVNWWKKNVGTEERPWTNTHLFLYGKTQMGKTTFVKNLENYFKIYYVPMDEDFYDMYNDEYDFCVFEEFKSQKRIQWLNKFMDGNNLSLRKKGGQVLRMKPTPCIILSNYKLEECYPNVAEKYPDVLKTLERRMTKIYVDEFISLQPIPVAPAIEELEEFKKNKKN